MEKTRIFAGKDPYLCMVLRGAGLVGGDGAAAVNVRTQEAVQALAVCKSDDDVFPYQMRGAGRTGGDGAALLDTLTKVVFLVLSFSANSRVRIFSWSCAGRTGGDGAALLHEGRLELRDLLHPQLQCI